MCIEGRSLLSRKRSSEPSNFPVNKYWGDKNISLSDCLLDIYKHLKNILSIFVFSLSIKI